jgi:uncharacterized protein
MDYYINKLSEILEKNNVCKSHGIEHAIKVYENAILSIEYENDISDFNKEAILIASLLHDADDQKFFPNNFNDENTRIILKKRQKDFIDLVIEMINLVSSSKNGDNIPNHIKNKLWMLIPRYCDRLEAIGKIGIVRCYQYGITQNSKLFIENTQKATTKEEIYKIATIERYDKYIGKSDSMIDHYYDKLLRAHMFPINNKFLLENAKERNEFIINFIIKFGKTGTVDVNEIKQYAVELNINL